MPGPRRFLYLISAPDRAAQLRLVHSRAAIMTRRDPSLLNREHAVAQTRELAEIAGIDQGPAAAGADVADKRVDLCFGRAIDAWGGIVEQQHGNWPRQPF